MYEQKHAKDTKATDPKLSQAEQLSGVVIGAAIEVHRHLGPGLLESIYEKCLAHELRLRGIKAQRQVPVPLQYKDLIFDETLKLDLLVEDCLLIELKACETIHPIHKAQVLSYMRLLDVPLGLLINFHEPLLKNGLHRLILQPVSPRADRLIS
jgi:GxxExxY protein